MYTRIRLYIYICWLDPPYMPTHHRHHHKIYINYIAYNVCTKAIFKLERKREREKTRDLFLTIFLLLYTCLILRIFQDKRNK